MTISSMKTAGRFGSFAAGNGAGGYGTTIENPGTSAANILSVNPSAQSGFYYIQFSGSGWASPKKIYCDMTDGGWMLWAQRLNSGTTMDMRYSGFFAGYSADASKGYINEWTNLDLEGHVNMWSYMNGSRWVKAIYNVTGRTSTNAGTGTLAVQAQENGSTFATANYTGVTTWSTGSCPPGSYKYNWSNTSVASWWLNRNPNALYYNCSSEWPYVSQTYVSNWIAGGDCGGCANPSPNLFGNGVSGYYNYGDYYDYDLVSYSMSYTSLNAPTKTATTYNSNTQLWIK